MLSLTPHRLLNFVYSWAIVLVPPEKLEEWQEELVELLPWQDATSAAAEEVESASFFQMQAQQQ